jgi:hypothetical protein
MPRQWHENDGAVEVQAAIGVEHRKEDLRICGRPSMARTRQARACPPPTMTSSCTRRDPTRGDRNDQRLCRGGGSARHRRSRNAAGHLELSASGRFEHHSDFGNTTKPKIEPTGARFPG